MSKLGTTIFSVTELKTDIRYLRLKDIVLCKLVKASVICAQL